MGDREVSISWKKAGSNIEESLRSHALKSFCSDLSIICEDNEEVKAHKLILCSRSSFLKQLLLENELALVQHPKLILCDTSRECLENILTFIYHGTVSISQDRLKEFKSALVNLGIEKPISEKRIRNQEQTNHVKKVKLEADPFSIKEERISDADDDNADNDFDFEHLEDLLNDGYESDHNDRDRQVADIKTDDDKSSNEKKEDIAEEGKIQPNTIMPNIKKRKGKEEIGSFMCPECGVIYTMKKLLKQHIESVHEGIRHPCDQCAYQGKTKGLLRKHKIVHHEKRRHYCDQCDYMATDKKGLKIHMEAKHFDVRYPCDLCDHQATQPGNLKKHKDSVHFKIKHKCHLCTLQFSQDGHLRKHLRLKHGVDTRTYQTSSRDF